jgi:alpha-tubulin suppressor-like RCC1 family protein
LYAFGCHCDYHERHIREEPAIANINVPDKNEKIYPFGYNDIPVHVPLPVHVVDMATGGFGDIVIGENGNVYTWGVGTKGELGRPLSHNSIKYGDGDDDYLVDFIKNEMMQPTIVPAIQGKVAISVACGQGHLMVVVREPGHLESTVYGSGLNQDGQLGLGDFEDRPVLTPVSQVASHNMAYASIL